MRDNKVYIYNKDQALFYMKSNLELLDIGVHNKTNKPFWVFRYDEHKKIFGKWINRNK